MFEEGCQFSEPKQSEQVFVRHILWVFRAQIRGNTIYEEKGTFHGVLRSMEGEEIGCICSDPGICESISGTVGRTLQRPEIWVYIGKYFCLS